MSNDFDHWYGLRTELVNLDVFNIDELKHVELFMVLNSHLESLGL